MADNRNYETTVDFIVHVNSRDLVFLQSVIEGYEHHAGFTTIDPKNGVSRIFVAPYAVELMEEVIEGLKEILDLRIISVIGRENNLLHSPSWCGKNST